MARPPEFPSRGPLEEGPRASDAERDRVVVSLREHYAAGQITLDEFVERMETALVARSKTDLEVLTSDLPVPAAGMSIDVSKQPGKIRRATRWTVGVMSGQTRRGRWRIEGQTNAVAFMGGIVLDLREAQLVPDAGLDEVEILAIAFMGGIEIIVPEGMHIDLDGFNFMGGSEDKSKPGELAPGVPTVRVRGYAVMGGIEIKTRGPRVSRADRQLERQQRREERGQRHLDQRARHIDRRLDRGRPAGQLPIGPGGARVARRWAPALEKLLRDERLVDRLRNAGIEVDSLMSSVDAVASWAMGEHVDLRSHAAPDGTITILFTDIEGSTAINERLGDRRWHEILTTHNDVIRTRVKEHGGSEVRSLGDGFMVVFSSALRALQCAKDVQRSFATYSESHPDEPIRVRIGCHTGEAIRDADDYFGRNVVLAARIADQATGGQILVSSLVKELTESAGELDFVSPREVELQGMTGTRVLYEVSW